MKFNLIPFILALGIIFSFSTIADAMEKNYIRWSKATLNVFIDRNETVPGYKQSYAVNVAKALAAWKQNSNNKINFKIVNNPNQADIIVNWSDRIKQENYSKASKEHKNI